MDAELICRLQSGVYIVSRSFAEVGAEVHSLSALVNPLRVPYAPRIQGKVELAPPGCIAAMEGRVPPRPAFEEAKEVTVERE